MSDSPKFRDRKFVMVLYPEDASHAAAIEKMKAGGYNFAAILHDKDVTEDNQPKKPHWHVVVRFKNACWNTAIAKDLGITPNSDGTVVRLPFPAPTEERRRELVKECREYAEQAKVSIRNIRRDFNTKLERDEELTEDDVRREQAKVQKHTDEYVAKVEQLLKEKEAEVMEI